MEQMSILRPSYQSYLIRFWREGPDAPWRATVIRSGIEQIYHFAEFESLVAFLDQRLAEETAVDQHTAAAVEQG